MDIKKLDQVNKAANRIEQIRKNLGLLMDWQEKYPNGDSDGSGSSSGGTMYGLHVGEHGDGSGSRALNLTGLMVNTELLESLRKLLEARLEEDTKFIESV